mgnify:CR=1 FL=1
MPIEVKRLCHTYLAGTAGEKAALRDIELNIEKGEFFGIIGHTGSGKSTLLQHMGGIMPPEAGTVIVDGYDFADKKQRIEGRKKVGLVFQYPEYQLFEETVAKDIAFGPKNMKLKQEEIDRRVRRAMELVGLDWERFAEKSPFELSGGEKRRAALAGIIAMEPGYLILDEPMAGLDPAGRRAILDMLSGIRRETGCAVIMVSHSMDDIAAYSDRVAVMQDGSIIRTGTPAEIFGGELDLEAMGLDLPAASGLGNLLRSKGMDVPEIYTIDGMAEYLLGRRQGA